MADRRATHLIELFSLPRCLKGAEMEGPARVDLPAAFHCGKIDWLNGRQPDLKDISVPHLYMQGYAEEQTDYRTVRMAFQQADAKRNLNRR